MDNLDVTHILKNYEYIIRNPRHTKYTDKQFPKDAFLHNKKNPYKTLIAEMYIDFIDARKIIMTEDLVNTISANDYIMGAEFLPYYDNQILLVENPNPDQKGNHIGFWIRDRKDYFLVSAFICLSDYGLVNLKIDWGISKTKSLWNEHWEKESSTHGNNKQLLKSWFSKDEAMFQYYYDWCKPFQHWAMKNPIENPYVRELDFQNKEEIFIPIKVHHFIWALSNLKNENNITLKDPEERQANLRKKKPFSYQYKILEITDSKKTNFIYKRNVNKNRFHEVRGFYRHYKSGKRTWIKNHSRGNKSIGIIQKDYKISKTNKEI
tara:strand:+ start:6044 stop:7006 length:963 start_codon:yes stop_codon:yes gene_type:complete